MFNLEQNCFNIFILASIFLLQGCSSSESPFLFPAKDKQEIFRICRYLGQRGKNEFIVDDGKIAVKSKVVGRVYDPNIKTYLSDGYYRCGRADSGIVPCSVGASSIVGGQRCSFQR